MTERSQNSVAPAMDAASGYLKVSYAKPAELKNIHKSGQIIENLVRPAAGWSLRDDQWRHGIQPDVVTIG